MKTFTCLYLLLLCLPAMVWGQATEKRVALLIGNSTYQGGRQLQNPVHDAVLMSKTLQSLGFKTILDTNLTQIQMRDAFVQFSREADDAKVNLIYYSGHGIQVGTNQYLVPVDADPKTPKEVSLMCMDIKTQLDVLAFDTSKFNIVILDACRSNPFKNWTRGGEGGFAKLLTPEGSIMAYATDEGQTADDNPYDSNGLYTKYLCQEITKPIPVYQIFRNTRKLVLDASHKQQSPNFSDKSIGDFYFSLPLSNNLNTVAVTAPVSNQPSNPTTSTGNGAVSVNDVKQVFYYNADKTLYTSFVNTDDKRWIEARRFHWVELNRNNNQIYLRDADGRNYDIMLDLPSKQVRLSSDGGNSWGVLYKIAAYTTTVNSETNDESAGKQLPEDPGNDINIPVGKVVGIRGANNKFVSSANGAQAVTCDQATVQETESFLVTDAGDGKIALQSMGKYMSSEDGLQPITCSSATLNDSEKFEWVTNTDGTFSLRGNNGKYVSSEPGTAPMNCNHPLINAWGKFTYVINE